jgi:hypothetical protein
MDFLRSGFALADRGNNHSILLGQCFDLVLYTQPWVSRMEYLADLYEHRVRDDELYSAAVCKLSRSFGPP